MFHLMKKNSSYVIQFVILAPFLAVAWLITSRPLDTYHIFMGGMWMVLVVLGGAISGEIHEEKNKGYAFLKLLPIKERDIVMSKFLMAVLTAAAFVLHIKILLSFFPGPPRLFALARIMIPLCAGAALLLTAFLYILVYSIGFSRFVKIAWTVFFLAILAPILIIEFVLRRFDPDYGQVIDSIISLPWPVLVLVGLAFVGAYLGALELAVRAKKARAA